jgi:PAS domain S-box-containing protein
MISDPTPQPTSALDQTALVVADARGRIVYWSGGATALFGYTAQAMVGKAASVLVPSAYRRRHIAGWRHAWASGDVEPSGAVMVPVVCADGETRAYASHIFPIRDPYGRLVAVGAAWTPPHDRDASLRLIGAEKAS